MKMTCAHGARLTRYTRGWLALASSATLVGCGSPSGLDTTQRDIANEPGAPERLVDSKEAQARIADLRMRFPGALGDPWADRFESTEEGALRGHGPANSTAVTIDVPRDAAGFTRITDDSSGLTVRFALEGASPRSASVSDGVALYPAAGPGDSDLILRPGPSGAEDFILLQRAPATPEVRYRLDVSAIAGLRLVGNTLEMLDAGGAPRLRVARARVFDAAGARHEARLEVQGCQVDTSPRAPWGRPVTAPGAAYCTLVVAFPTALRFPALVDPSWENTKTALVTARAQHTMTSLDSENTAAPVLVAGGFDEDGAPLASAELYDPLSRTFATTGPLGTARGGHTATGLRDALTGKVLVVGGLVPPIGGGNAEPTGTMERYRRSTGHFESEGIQITPRRDHTATLLANGNVLIAGGSDALGQPLSSVVVYDPATAAIVPQSPASMLTARAGHAAVLLTDGRVLLTGGFSSSNAVKTTEVYSPLPAPGAFTDGPPMALSRAFHTATLLGDGRVLIAGGKNTLDPASGVIRKDVEIYQQIGNSPASFKLLQSPQSQMHATRCQHTATWLPASGQVVLAGGFGDTGSNAAHALRTTDLFVVATETFETGPDMAELRYRHAAIAVNAAGTVLDGHAVESEAVLVTGGSGFSITPVLALPSAQLLLRPLGDGCTAGGQCASGYCHDGVCCDSACDSVCLACNAGDKQDGSPSGKCGARKNGAQLSSICANDVEIIQSCNGAGATVLESSIICNPYRCDAQTGHCLNTCAPIDPPCSADGWCFHPDGGGTPVCKLRYDDGVPCTSSDQCKENHPCTDGVCCNVSCNGQCEACDIPGKIGTCSPVAQGGQPHPNNGPDGNPQRPACLGDEGSVCRGTCDGSDVQSCHYPDSTTNCGASECTCSDAAGDCRDEPGHEHGQGCENGACVEYDRACGDGGLRCAGIDAGPSTACLASCSSEDDCTRGFTCEDHQCIVLTKPTCHDEGILRHPDGPDENCSPYVCQKGPQEDFCPKTCQSVHDCLGENACNLEGHCVARPDHPQSAGCSAHGPARRPAGRSAALLFAALLAATALRRRRRANTL